MIFRTGGSRQIVNKGLKSLACRRQKPPNVQGQKITSIARRFVLRRRYTSEKDITIMPRSFGEPLTRLRAVAIRDNGETLIDPRTLSRRVRFAEEHPHFKEMKCVPSVRASVAQMIADAANALPAGIDLIIIEGFRPLHQQRFMYESLKADFAKRHPEWSKATLHRITNTMSAPPDDRCPPPHTTGGAVDLGLVRAADGEMLDMSSPFEMDETSAPSDLKGLTAEAQANRALLFDVLTPTGLTNYIGEWWHWSYGDSGWALRTGAEYALYDRLPEANNPP